MRIDEGAFRSRHCGVSAARRSRSPIRQNVDHGLAGCDEIIRNDAAITLPPGGFLAHHTTAAAPAPTFRSLRSPDRETPSNGSMVVKTFVLPEAVQFRWNALAMDPQMWPVGV
jgi:hypothetical protein